MVIIEIITFIITIMTILIIADNGAMGPLQSFQSAVAISPRRIDLSRPFFLTRHIYPSLKPLPLPPVDPGQARVCALLQENMVAISSIRENIVMGRFLDNHSLMINFDKNVKEVTALLATLPFAEMQKLPVQVYGTHEGAQPF